ncbi:hypothetical protein, partial [Mycobacterium sp.]|uniref:hypothetical protein n=1 Tax=Mycobacterium sp. TaxID=1785 RepID=UPI0031D4DF31
MRSNTSARAFGVLPPGASTAAATALGAATTPIARATLRRRGVPAAPRERRRHLRELPAIRTPTFRVTGQQLNYKQLKIRYVL